MNLNDTVLVGTFHNFQLQDKLIFYHALGRKQYENSAVSKKSKEKNRQSGTQFGMSILKHIKKCANLYRRISLEKINNFFLLS